MQSTLPSITRVLSGNCSEIQFLSLAEGEEVDVFVVLRPDISAIKSQGRAAQWAQIANNPKKQAELAAIDAEFAPTKVPFRSAAGLISSGCLTTC
jgi:hypothetical protein